MQKTDNPEGRTFGDLGLDPGLLNVLSDLGYEEPTPIQSEAIPVVISGSDVLGQAATGTGKTAAFALPVLHRLADKSTRSDSPAALVLVPTRELAIQVSSAIHKYGKALDIRVTPIYGGQPIGRQLSSLERGVDVVVATPGRAIDCINRNKLDLSKISTVVLDEADEMLDMGFAEDLETILDLTPKDRQTVLFSATMPRRIESLARQHMNKPVRIEIERKALQEGEEPKVRQLAYIVGRAHKAAALGRILDVESPSATIVFCRTRQEVDQLTETLTGRGYRAEALHGGMDQQQRDRVMQRVRKELADLLIATDVAARGLDIDHLTHVVNYDVPSAPESYVHRIGRVGRAGREGVAITLAEPREHRMLKTIERVTKRNIEMAKMPSVEDLRSRRLQKTQSILFEALQKGDLDHYRPVVEALSDEFDIVEVALAAIRIAHESTAGSDAEENIPEASIDLRDRKSGNGRGFERKGGKFGDRGNHRDGGGYKGRERGNGETMARLWVSAGKIAGVRPQDLVGAIANQASLRGNQVGDIRIMDKFSLVEVPEFAAEKVIKALRNTTIRGSKATIRRDRPQK